MFNKVLVPVDVTMKKDTEKLLNAAKILTAGWTCEIHVATIVPMGAVRRMRTRIRLLAQPVSMRSIVGATQ